MVVEGHHLRVIVALATVAGVVAAAVVVQGALAFRVILNSELLFVGFHHLLHGKT
jgi:hypothetical protein